MIFQVKFVHNTGYDWDSLGVFWCSSPTGLRILDQVRQKFPNATTEQIRCIDTEHRAYSITLLEEEARQIGLFNNINIFWVSIPADALNRYKKLIIEEIDNNIHVYYAPDRERIFVDWLNAGMSERWLYPVEESSKTKRNDNALIGFIKKLFRRNNASR